MKSKIAVAAVAGVTIAGVLTTSPAMGGTTHSVTHRTAKTVTAAKAVKAASTSTIAWGPCSEQDLAAAGAQCAMLAVPRNYKKPNGKKIHLAISIIRHTSAKSKGVMLSNPGGPGGSGLDLPVYVIPAIPHGVGHDYDWVGFDPRGVGHSTPTIRCLPNYFHYDRRNYIPKTKSLVRYWKKRSKRYANACEKKYPALLKHMTTKDVAMDMNSIRKALGVKQINYYGYSYGTYLGQVFSTLYPHRVHRMILDSNVDPRGVWYADNLDQDVAFNRNIKIWFKWLANHHKAWGLGKTEKSVQNRWYHYLHKLAKHPAGGKIGPDEWTDLFLYAGYYEQTWNQLANDFSNYAHHRKGAVKTLETDYASFQGLGDDNEFAVYNAVQCTDVQWPQKWSTWKRDNDRVYKEAPFETWDNAWFNAPCLYWGAKAHKPVTINGKHVKSALLIDETLDAATPFPGSLEVRKLYPHSSLIAVPGGTTHAESPDGESCEDNAIASYLKTGHRPHRKSGNRPDKDCKAPPKPKPEVDHGGSSAHMSTAQRVATRPLIRI